MSLRKAFFILSASLMGIGGFGKVNSLGHSPQEPKPDHNPKTTTTLMVIGGLGALAFSRNWRDINEGNDTKKPATSADFKAEFPFILNPNGHDDRSMHTKNEVGGKNTFKNQA